MKRLKNLFVIIVLNAAVYSVYAQSTVVTRESMYLNGNVIEMLELVSIVEEKFGQVEIGSQTETHFIGFNPDGTAYEYRDNNGKRLYEYKNGRLSRITYEGFDDLYVKLNGRDEYTYDMNKIRIDSYDTNGKLREVKIVSVNDMMQYLDEKKYTKDGKLASINKYEYINERMVQYISYNEDGKRSMIKSIEYDEHGNKIKIIEDVIFLKVITMFDYFENGFAKSRISITSGKQDKVEFEYEFDSNLNIVEKREYKVEEKYGETTRVLTKIYTTRYEYK